MPLVPGHVTRRGRFFPSFRLIDGKLIVQVGPCGEKYILSKVGDWIRFNKHGRFQISLMTAYEVVLDITIPRKSWNPKAYHNSVLVDYYTDLTVAQGLFVSREVTNEERERWRKILKKIKPAGWARQRHAAEVFVDQPNPR